ncbi:MAG: DsbA family protein [archaeon]
MKTNVNRPVTVVAFFDFVCPWSYLTKSRVERALHRTKTKAIVQWVPFELYEHNGNHRVHRRKIMGNEHLTKVYAQLHELGMRENLLIQHPRYEHSSRRALTGFLYAQKKGVGNRYLDEIFAHTFEHVNEISSLALLGRVAVKLGLDAEEMITFIEKSSNQELIQRYTSEAKQNGVRGLPTYIVNDLPVTGALSTNDWVDIFQSAQRNEMPAFLLPLPKKIIPPSAPRKKKTVKTITKTVTITKMKKTTIQKRSPAKKHKKKTKKRR